MYWFDKFLMILYVLYITRELNSTIMSIRNDIKPPKPLFLVDLKSQKFLENICEISKSAQVRLAILQYFILSSRLNTNLQ